MDPGIQFGNVERREPRKERRPDRDGQYSVVACGEPSPEDLAIYVDLDVIRDLEGHARTNMRVELGGVLLGARCLDSDGVPFVVVRESIRAEHYEATRGSFKFTHDTWSDITRKRAEFPEEYQLVGWYHTHPDWGVFLSGMDLFICENFFGGELDIALVLDPCRGDRGWFHWSDAKGNRVRRRVNGFRLFTSRFRHSELLHFAQELAGPNPSYYDSRYESPSGETEMQPVVHLHQPTMPPYAGFAIAGILTIQTLILALLAWNSAFGGRAPETGTSPHAMDSRQLEQVLGKIVAAGGNGEELVRQLGELGADRDALQSSLRGQAMLIEELEAANKTLEIEKAGVISRLAKADDQTKSLRDEMEALNQEVGQLRKGVAPSGLNWIYVAGAGVVGALLGVAGGWFLAIRESTMDDSGNPEADVELR